MKVWEEREEEQNIFSISGKQTLDTLSNPEAAVITICTTPQVSFFHSTRHPVIARASPRVTHDISTIQPACWVLPHMWVSRRAGRGSINNRTWSRWNTGKIAATLWERKCVVKSFFWKMNIQRKIFLTLPLVIVFYYALQTLTLFWYGTIGMYIHRFAQVSRHYYYVCRSIYVSTIYRVSIPVCPVQMII